MRQRYIKVACAAIFTGLGTHAQGAIIFDDFNTSLGHFNQPPNFSSTNTSLDPANSSSTRITTDSEEGTASDRLIFTHDTTTTTALRVRFVSGSGTPANNTAFTLTTGTDGFIGFYAKNSTPGWNATIALDGAGNTAAEMDGGVQRTLSTDGQWHLYEWNLDLSTDWTNVPGIGGGHTGGPQAVSHTIDSIFFFGPTTQGASNTMVLDFVALNDQGSVAGLVPEPGMLSLGGLAMLGLARRRRA
jgi:hypothetical protein